MNQPVYGQSVIARWCGVTINVISMWILRYDDWPQPVVEILTSEDPSDPNYPYPMRGWSPDQRSDWEAYAALERGKRHWRKRSLVYLALN